MFVALSFQWFRKLEPAGLQGQEDELATLGDLRHSCVLWVFLVLREKKAGLWDRSTKTAVIAMGYQFRYQPSIFMNARKIYHHSNGKVSRFGTCPSQDGSSREPNTTPRSKT